MTGRGKKARFGRVGLVQRQGLANTTSPSPFHRPDARLRWLEPVEDTQKRTRMWDRIVSGDRAAKVLAA